MLACKPGNKRRTAQDSGKQHRRWGVSSGAGLWQEAGRAPRGAAWVPQPPRSLPFRDGSQRLSAPSELDARHVALVALGAQHQQHAGKRQQAEAKANVLRERREGRERRVRAGGTQTHFEQPLPCSPAGRCRPSMPPQASLCPLAFLTPQACRWLSRSLRSATPPLLSITSLAGASTWGGRGGGQGVGRSRGAVGAWKRGS